MKNSNLPAQVESLISSLLNKGENVYIRANYRTRLNDIRQAVDEAIRKFDVEYDSNFTSRGEQNVKRKNERITNQRD